MSLPKLLHILIFLHKLITPYVVIFRNILSPLNNRLVFEMKNLSDPNSKSFLEIGSKADFCFEVSSEGEYQQISYILNRLLDLDYKIELIYCSESLENKIQSLTANNLRTLRLPLVSAYAGNYSIRKWVTSDNIFLCRYDFFPELILAGLECAGEFGLVWASLKNKDFKRGGIKEYYLQEVYKSFDVIIAPLNEDVTRLREIGVQSRIFKSEFRFLAISQRLNDSIKTLSRFDNLNEFINKVDITKRHILGSAWNIDLNIFDNQNFVNSIKSGELVCAIVPHDLGAHNLELMIKTLERKIGYKIPVINDEHDELIQSNICLINIRGVLCELYSKFGHSYVGGGFGRSVHSLLEPYLAGSHVYSGVRIQRSTEYDLILENSPEQVSILPSPVKYASCIVEKSSLDTKLTNDLLFEANETMNKVFIRKTS